MSPRFSTTRPGVLLACPAAMQMPKMRVHSLWSLCSRCLRLFNSHTCSISQCNHKFWLNYRIKMFVLNLKMCVRVQHSVCRHCPAVLFSGNNEPANTSPTGLPSLQPLAVNQGRPSTSPSLTTIAVPNLKTGTHSPARTVECAANLIANYQRQLTLTLATTYACVSATASGTDSSWPELMSAERMSSSLKVSD